MSSSKKSREGSKKPSVFERLGSKPSSSGTEDYCKQWAHKGTCSYSSKCKFIETHNSKNHKPTSKDGRKRSRSRSPRKDGMKPKPAAKTASKSDNGEWEKSLEHEDELALERKLQMLQRELAKQEEQDHRVKVRKPTAKKRERSSSSSSTSTSSSSDSSSDSSDSSSSSSGSSSSSSSSSSDSDGELKEKKSTKKKPSRPTKRSRSSLSRNHAAKAKAKKIAKLSPDKKKAAASANKKHLSATRSPRLKEAARQRQDETARKAPPVRREMNSPLRGRSNERRMKQEKTRLLDPGYIVRPRSPGYRDPYSPASYRPPTYEARRYSPPPMKKEEMYGRRSPERRPQRNYEHEWPLDQGKIPEWDHPDYRRRSRPLDDVNWGRTEAWKKSYSPPPYPDHSRNAGWDPVPKADHKRRSSSRRDTKTPVPAPPQEVQSPGEIVHKPEEIEEARPTSSALDAEEDFSDFSDDVDEILNRDFQDPEDAKTDEVAEAEVDVGETPTETELKISVDLATPNVDVQSSPKVISPVVIEKTDEDLLGGMDIEQISDEELEDETKTVPVDALEVDWTSLACKREKKVETGAIGARQRWHGKEVLARLGIKGYTVSTEERKPLFDCSILFRRALSARMDLALRRKLCNLPVRELVIEHLDDDLNLYKTAVDLMLKDRVLAN